MSQSGIQHVIGDTVFIWPCLLLQIATDKSFSLFDVGLCGGAPKTCLHGREGGICWREI